MANYALVANSVFQPFTYQELAAPLDRQELYHEKLAEEYDQLSTQADLLEVLGKNDRDKESGAYSRYKSYSDALRQEADNLYRYGLNTESRQRLSDIKRRYNTDIRPIQNAWNKREEETKMQITASMNNPSIMFTRTAGDTPIDYYVDNPMGGFGVINGANITAQMSTMASKLAKQIREGKKENIDPYTYNYIEKYGLDENIIRDWRNYPTLKEMFEQVMQANGVTPEALDGSTRAQEIIDKSTNYAEMGMWSAMGEDKSQLKEDFLPRLNAQAAKEIRVHRAQKVIDQEFTQPQNTEIPTLPGETVPINFNDAESAGNNMKARLASATMTFLQKSNNPKAKKMLEQINKNGIDTTLAKWQKDGIDGKEFKDAGLYYSLGNYIRDNVTGNENLINIWRSPYKEQPVSSASAGMYSPSTGMYIRTSHNSQEKAPKKDWGKFDNISSNGYRVNMIDLMDDETALKSFLTDVITRNTRNGKTKLYDLKSISGNNEYTYSKEGLSVNELPKTSSGKDIDFSRIKRGMLSNGDYMLYWLDDRGNLVQKVLRRSDVGEQAARDWNNTDAGYKSAVALYAAGRITKEQFAELERRFGVSNMANAYLDTQRVNVKPVDVQ